MAKPFNKATFVLPDRYKVLRHLGSGAYGTVCACEEEKTGENVAIKKVTKVFERKILAKRTLREVKLLRHFQGHENITCILEIFRLDTGEDFNEIYLVQELMEADLHQIIRSHQKLTTAHFQYFIYQILRGLKYMHSANVIHRDLKPGNLLVNADCELKICDLGLARGLNEEPEQSTGPLMTEYVATRWYRAPEIMLSHAKYTQAIDVWSVGCIFGELLGGKVMFPGKDYVHQMSLIINSLGSPSEETLNRIASPRAQEWIRSLPKRERVPFKKTYPDADPRALDLLDRLLDFDPKTRITVPEALKHPFLELYHDESDEPDCEKPLDFAFEKVDTIEGIKELIAEEIKTYPAPARPTLQRKGSVTLLNPKGNEVPKSQAEPDDLNEPIPVPSLEDELNAMKQITI